MDSQELIAEILKRLVNLHGQFLDKARFNKDRPEIAQAYDISACSLNLVIQNALKWRHDNNEESTKLKRIARAAVVQIVQNLEKESA